MASPNVLWIGLDQIRKDTLLHGPEQVCKTPHIDRFAEQSVNFSRAYTPCSLCSPARASMLTGTYAFTHGMGTNCDMYHSLSAELRRPEDLLHRKLQEAGYRCGFSGKWHVGTEKGPGDYGFEGMNLPGYGNIRKDPGFQSYLAKHGLSYSPQPMYYLNPDKQTLIGGRWGGPVESTPDHYLANYTMDLIDQFSKESPDKPFFITCQFWGPHGPHMPSDEYYLLHDRQSLTPWPNLQEDVSSKPRRLKRERDSFFRSYPKNWEEAREIVGLYYDTVSQIDHEVGRLIQHLEHTGLSEDTIVILSTDHGDMTGAHGGMMDKGLLYEEAHHIPLYISYPNRIEPAICDDLVMNMDIMPTVLDYAEIKIPCGLHGTSLRGALEKQPERYTRDSVYLEFHGLRFLYSQRALVTRSGWKYIFTPGDYDEVYHVFQDPYEMNNCIDDPSLQDTIAELRDCIRKAAAAYGDPLSDCISKFFGIWYTGSGQVDASKFFDS